MDSNFLSNNMDALADDEARNDIRKYFLTEALEGSEFNTIKRRNKFMGTVVSYGPEADVKQAQAQGRIIPVKARLDELQDSFLPFPIKGQFTQYEKQICFSCHATVYPRRAGTQENGDYLPVIGQRSSFYFANQSPDYFGRMRDLRYEYARTQVQGQYVATTEDYDSSYKNKGGQTQLGKYATMGLQPQKGIYNGTHMPKGTPVLNGYPKHGKTLLKAANPKYCTTKHNRKVYVLADYVDGLNGLAKAHFARFNQKLICSGIRTFDGQIAVRSEHVRKQKCKNMTVPSGGPMKCPSATPGKSDHGWGQAIDLTWLFHNRTSLREYKRTTNKPLWQWMAQTAPQHGWIHPDWASERAGTIYEAWHWEPKNKVIKKL